MAPSSPTEPRASVDALLRRGLAAHRAGDGSLARSIYGEVIALAPANADAHHLLGLLALQERDFAGAIGCFRAAIAIAPAAARFYLSLGKAFYAEGAMESAVAALADAVARDPAMVEAQVLRGGALAALGRHDQAAAALAAAAALSPQDADIQCHLAAALVAGGRFDQAVAVAESALRLRPHYPPALVNLGSALRQLGQLDPAAAAYREAVRHADGPFAAWLGLGAVLRVQKKTEEALAAFGRAALLAPAQAQPHLEAGETLAEAGRHGQAMEELQKAIHLAPQSAEAYLALGAALHQLGRTQEALAALRQAAVLRPDLPEAHYNLGVVEAAGNGPHAAIAHYQKAIALRPDYAAAHINLAEALRMSGRVAEALPHARRAIDLEPGNSLIHSGLLYAMHYSDETTPESLLAEHRRWAARHVEPLCAGVTHDNDARPGRRLRVGYVSPDFRDHSLARYVLPILENHDHEAFEVFLYSVVARPDAVTERCRRAGDHFRAAAALSDEALAGMIREDRIDILVDLSQHMGGNRQMTFARRPAPVQVAAFGYPSTSGSPAIDVRVSDRYVEPAGLELAGPERIAWMPHSYWCFSPHDDAALPRSAARPPPVFANGYITFGSLNNPAKTTATALSHWAGVLRAVPGSRLLLGSGIPGDAPVRAAFAALGIDPGRIDFVPKAPRAGYLEYYRRIDIGLDPFPYAGHSTSCDAFWMGVPVLTVAPGGSALPVSRAGASLLHALGLPELIAATPESLGEKAAGLANDWPRLRELSITMRERMLRSPLMDAVAYTRALEAIYREAWERWCARSK